MPQIPRAPSPCRRGGGAESGVPPGRPNSSPGSWVRGPDRGSHPRSGRVRDLLRAQLLGNRDARAPHLPALSPEGEISPVVLLSFKTKEESYPRRQCGV